MCQFRVDPEEVIVIYSFQVEEYFFVSLTPMFSIVGVRRFKTERLTPVLPKRKNDENAVDFLGMI